MTKYVLPSGATRSERAYAFHLIPSSGIIRIAERFALGANTHGENNWKLACATEADAHDFAIEAHNHLVAHVLRMSDRRHVEYLHDDDLGAIGWAVCVLAYIEERFGKPWTSLTPAASSTATQDSQ
jgi:hypothetical protein